MTESATSQVIRQMIASKLIRRTVDPADKRARLIFLTKKGLELREKVVVEGLKTSTKHTPQLSPDDVKTAIFVLQEIRKAFDAYNNEYFQNK